MNNGVTRCQQPQAHPARCGCEPAGTEQVSSAWLAQLREEYRLFGSECQRLRAENEQLETERAEQWRLRRDAEAARDTNAAVVAELRAELQALKGVADEREAVVCDRSYVNWLKAGWNFAASGDDTGFTRSVEGRMREIRVALAAAPKPTQKALPCPDCNGFKKQVSVYQGGIPCPTCQQAEQQEPVQTEHDPAHRAMWHTNCLNSRFGGPMKPTALGWECVSCGATKAIAPQKGQGGKS